MLNFLFFSKLCFGNVQLRAWQTYYGRAAVSNYYFLVILCRFLVHIAASNHEFSEIKNHHINVSNPRTLCELLRSLVSYSGFPDGGVYHFSSLIYKKTCTGHVHSLFCVLWLYSRCFFLFLFFPPFSGYFFSYLYFIFEIFGLDTFISWSSLVHKWCVRKNRFCSICFLISALYYCLFFRRKKIET